MLCYSDTRTMRASMHRVLFFSFPPHLPISHLHRQPLPLPLPPPISILQLTPHPMSMQAVTRHPFRKQCYQIRTRLSRCGGTRPPHPTKRKKNTMRMPRIRLRVDGDRRPAPAPVGFFLFLCFPRDEVIGSIRHAGEEVAVMSGQLSYSLHGS